MSNVMTSAKLLEVQLRVYNVCKNGSQVTLSQDLSDGDQDDFGETLQEDVLKLFAFPIRFTPFDRKARLNVEWMNEVEVIMYVSAYEVQELNGLIALDLEKYNYVYYDYKRYTIKKIHPYCNFGTGFLYYLLGVVHV